MGDSFGKLVLVQQDRPEQEFDLGKATVNLGRATTNDIVLNDGRVSRSHARLECNASACKIIDLGSSNGTRVNGVRIEQVELHPGDTISLGGSQLRFEASQPYEEVGLTMIDSEIELDHTIDHEILPVSINETQGARLVIFTSQKTWEVSLEDTDRLTFGRSEGNQVVIEHPKVSRQHAEILRKGGIFILRDLGSTNGTWHKGEKVGELILQEGDAFYLGDAQVVFKSGFAEESLTMADGSFTRTSNRRPVIFIPGLMGSELWLGSERVWPNVKVMFKNPEVFRYPSSLPLEPRGIVDEVVIVPNLIKMDQYNRLGDYLVEELGYERGKDFFEFAYDWRQDVRISAKQLGALVESLPGSQPVTLIGHSLGTLVSRYYVERLGGKRRVERLMLLGGPHTGAVKGLTSLLIAPQVLPFGLMGERLRQVVITFPTSYQILPTYPCATDQNGNQINFLEEDNWVAAEHLPLLQAGRQFRQELGMSSSIPTLSVFGYGLKTIASVSLKRSPDGKLSDISYTMQPCGDSTVLEQSAVLGGSDIHPVQQYHGSLFVDNDVKMRLKVELARQFSA